MLLMIAYLLTCRVLGLAVLAFRGDPANAGSADADLSSWTEPCACRKSHPPRWELASGVTGQRGGALAGPGAKFPGLFDAVLEDAEIKIVVSRVQMPRMNSIMERWVQTCRQELLDRTLIWNQRHL